MPFIRLIIMLQIILYSGAIANENIYQFFEKHRDSRPGEIIFLNYLLEQDPRERNSTMQAIKYWAKEFGFLILESKPEGYDDGQNQEPMRFLKLKAIKN